jgi:GMP reductase
MDGVGTIHMAERLGLLGLFTCLTKDFITTSLIDNDIDLNPLRFAISTGISESDLKRLDENLTNSPYIEFICVDIANGYLEIFCNVIRSLREKYPTKTIIAGNVVTADMTLELIRSGADIVKVGIGSGSVCTTRIQTGVGYPQLSAIMECADAAHGFHAHIISDGGCTCPGDVAKAFGAGADFVMLGGMLAGHNEGGRNSKVTTIGIDEGKYVEFYGMSSAIANKLHAGGLKDYRSSEGRKVLIPYRGKVADTVQDILGGIRSTCTYVGASDLDKLSQGVTFVRVSKQYNNIFEGRDI